MDNDHVVDLEEVADKVCDDVCRWRVRAYEWNKDPDDAEKWLERNHCMTCIVNKLR